MANGEYLSGVCIDNQPFNFQEDDIDNRFEIERLLAMILNTNSKLDSNHIIERIDSYVNGKLIHSRPVMIYINFDENEWDKVELEDGSIEYHRK